MNMLVKLLGVVIVILTVSFIVKPELIKQYMAFWKDKKRLNMGGGISILLGILLLLAASQCTLPLVVTIGGIWAFIKGILIFVLGPQKMISWMDTLASKPVGVLRLLISISLAVGILLIYSA